MDFSELTAERGTPTRRLLASTAILSLVTLAATGARADSWTWQRNLELLPTMHADLAGLTAVEIAGADEGDKATTKQLREADTPMIPANPAKAPAPKPVEATKPETMAKPADALKEVAPAEPPKKAEPKMAKPEPAPTPTPASDTTTSSMTDIDLRHYVRADVSYGWVKDPDATASNGALRNVDVGETSSFGLGAGFRLNDMFRVDGRLAYRPENDIGGTDAAGRATNTDVEAVTAMVNAYADVTPFHDWVGSDRVTPYVGAGIGYARLDSGDRSIAGAASERGETSDNFAFQLMTGVSVRVSDQLFVDIGYRFANLGQVKQSGSFTNGSTALATEFDDLLVHEANLGLRLQF